MTPSLMWLWWLVRLCAGMCVGALLLVLVVATLQVMTERSKQDQQ